MTVYRTLTNNAETNRFYGTSSRIVMNANGVHDTTAADTASFSLLSTREVVV